MSYVAEKMSDVLFGYTRPREFRPHEEDAMLRAISTMYARGEIDLDTVGVLAEMALRGYVPYGVADPRLVHVVER